MSAHRTPADVAEFAQNAYKRDFGVIIAAAGRGGASCGLYCRKHNFAVIGIPIKASTFDGLDALLATVQMPSGVPVATVAVDGAATPRYFAAQMLSLAEPALHEKA